MVVKIRELLRERPSLAYVPIAEIRGRVVTLEDLARLLELRDPEAERVARRLGIDPPKGEEARRLAIEFWRRTLPPNVKIHVLGCKSLTVEEAIKEIERGTEVGEELVRAYERFVRRYIK